MKADSVVMEVDPDDPILTTPLPRYNAMLAVLRNTLFMSVSIPSGCHREQLTRSCYRYGGIFEKGSREYTLDDFHSLQLDKMDRYVCLKPTDVVIDENDESSSDDDDDDDDDEEDSEEDDFDDGATLVEEETVKDKLPSKEEDLAIVEEEEVEEDIAIDQETNVRGLAERSPLHGTILANLMLSRRIYDYKQPISWVSQKTQHVLLRMSSVPLSPEKL